ncbi:MAG: EamA family transporter [Mailhella sp.]|nr:EamA family transporter [Mailhella sp.]
MPAVTNRRGLLILLCLFLVSASWGSCYLFIELALRSFPPFLLTATRLGCAGAILFAGLWLLGHRSVPTLRDVRFACTTAFFMSVLSAGLMTVGQQYVPSGTVAMVMGSIPLWMVLAGWLFLKENRPSRRQSFGLLIGTASVIILGIRQGSLGMGSAFGMMCLACNMAGWVGGSLYAKAHAHDTKLSVLQSTALMLMAGGTELLLISLIMGETLDAGAVPMLGWISVLVLIFFGGITAYTCYFWLLEHTSTAVAISYDYVNPVVGMVLGYLVTGEAIDAVKIGICGAIILALYFVITGSRRL